LNQIITEDIKLAIIGLGYVGLPLAAAFGNTRSVVGFDINRKRIDELLRYYDETLELSSDEIKDSKHLTLSSDINDLRDANFYIVTVPTPINSSNAPDLVPILKATEMIGKILKKGDIVVYESTVYPGVTEEVCVPILEKNSALKFNKDFFAGYSPERINPGDKTHRLKDIVKVTSGSTPEIADTIDELYQSIIEAGTFKASTIKVAEAAKVIENTQRDVNIALINELSKIFTLLDVDTEEVLIAAGTKWNFLPFRPGLVGGHCIGVDPYYLTYKAQEHGYEPEIILAGRRLNDGMSSYVANTLITAMKLKGDSVDNQYKVLIMGLTFKENCPDLRNSKVFDVIGSLLNQGVHVDVCDPWVSSQKVDQEINILPIEEIRKDFYDGIILAVGHDFFFEMGIEDIKLFGNKNQVLYDLKYLFPSDNTDLRL
jgi:UDP-N-acetyl-D-glucosamine/UDP-N-acetyl-D-galactosamine dehydrogenase